MAPIRDTYAAASRASHAGSLGGDDAVYHVRPVAMVRDAVGSAIEYLASLTWRKRADHVAFRRRLVREPQGQGQCSSKIGGAGDYTSADWRTGWYKQNLRRSLRGTPATLDARVEPAVEVSWRQNFHLRRFPPIEWASRNG